MNTHVKILQVVLTFIILWATYSVADRIDVDYDYILWAVDNTLDDMAPGRFAHLYGADRDGNGLKEEDHLGLLSAVLLNNSPEIPIARVIAIQEGFRANMAQVERDLKFNINVAGQSFNFDVIAELRKEDPTLAFAVQYFLAGYMTCGDSVTFTFLNNFLKDLVRYFVEREGYGWVLNFINLNDYINFGPSRYVTFGNTGTNYLGRDGDIDGDGTSNIQAYAGAGTREVWFSRCKIVPPPRIIGVSVNPPTGVVDTGDQLVFTVSVAGGDGPLSFQWLRTNSNGYEFPYSFELVGTNSPTYVIPYATTLDGARFSVAVSDSASVYNPSTKMGGRQSWGVFTGVRVVPLQILSQPVGGFYNVGDRLVLEFRVKGGTTLPTYYWSHNGVVKGPNSYQWVIDPVTGSTQGTYQCRVVSGNQQVISNSVYIEVFGAGEPVYFEDANLEAAVRSALGFDQTKEIYEGDLLVLRTLDASSMGIRNLGGIHKIRNLETLILWDNQIENIDLLQYLKNLRVLNLARNQISNISPLQYLENLEKLYLWDNFIEDLTVLVSNIGLGEGDEIGLEGNPLSEEILCNQIPMLIGKGCIVTYDGICSLSSNEGTLEGEEEPEEGEGSSEGSTEGEIIVYPDCDIEFKANYTNATLIDAGNSPLPLSIPLSKPIQDIRLRIRLTHPDVRQLRFKLIPPQGNAYSVILLSSALPNGGTSFEGTEFSDRGELYLWEGVPPYTGVFKPETPFYLLQGYDMKGLWILQIGDTISGGQGIVHEWSLIFNSCQTEGATEGIVEGAIEGSTEEGTTEGSLDGELIEGEEVCVPHDADTNKNWYIELSELLRVIQFFNAGGYHCADNISEDGFAPGYGGYMGCKPHSSDYSPADFKIGLNELLRLIQFFNSRGKPYGCDPTTEDGYIPGIE